jgi:hypothetical protein
MGSIWRNYFIHCIHLPDGSVRTFVKIAINDRCINSRRIRRGGGPVRYTGWTVPTYNQSQQQYGYPENTYNLNNNPHGQYPAGQYAEQSYQGPPAPAAYGAPAGAPAYYDATQTGGNQI